MQPNRDVPDSTVPTPSAPSTEQAEPSTPQTGSEPATAEGRAPYAQTAPPGEFHNRLVLDVIDAVKGILRKEASDRLRDVYLIGDIEKDVGRGVIERLREFANDSPRPITLYMNTAGGNVTDGLAIHDAIRQIVNPPSKRLKASAVDVTLVDDEDEDERIVAALQEEVDATPKQRALASDAYDDRLRQAREAVKTDSRQVAQVVKDWVDSDE